MTGRACPCRHEHRQERKKYKDIEINALHEPTEYCFRELDYSSHVTMHFTDESEEGLTVRNVGDGKPKAKE